MDWRSIGFDWNRARAFLVTAEKGSLSAAARALNMTQSTLGRQVTALEKELGVTLFERVGRGLEITPSGLDLMEHVRAMGEAANQLSLAASGRSQNLEGNVCISATEAMAAFVLPPIVKELRERAPGITVEIIADNRSSDLRRREADIAIRNFQPIQPDLISVSLKQIYAHFYATPDYLASLGNPQTKQDLAKGQFIGFADNTRFIEGVTDLGVPITSENFPIITENHLVHWELVKQGAGIGVMPELIGDREPLVIRALASLPPFPVDTWVVTHGELKTNRRIRMVFDYLVESLGQLFSNLD